MVGPEIDVGRLRYAFNDGQSFDVEPTYRTNMKLDVLDIPLSFSLLDIQSELLNVAVHIFQRSMHTYETHPRPGALGQAVPWKRGLFMVEL